MKILVRLQGHTHQIDIDEQENLDGLKALIEIETQVPCDQQVLTLRGSILNQDHLLLSQLGIGHNCQLELTTSAMAPPQANLRDIFKNTMQQMGMAQHNNVFEQQVKMEAQRIRRHYETNEAELNYLLNRNPEMATAVLSDDPRPLEAIIRKQKQEVQQQLAEQQKKRNAILNDPMNPEHQRMIEEEIAQQQIEEQHAYAMEHMPETFAQVTMLYINITINKTQVQAFVDSGAQTTIMSLAMARTLGLERLVDRRFAGQAVGVGVGKIVGRVHCAEMTIQGHVFPLSITILEDDKMDFLFGLDMLKRHQVCIDLVNNQLVFHNQSLKVPFLQEAHIKRKL